MLVIAENLNTRNRAFMKAVDNILPEAIRRLAGELVDAGANVLNIQCSTDGISDKETLPEVVQAISQKYDITLSLDSRNIEALRRTIPLCRKPPIINYLSLNEKSRAEMLDLCRSYNCRLILRAMDRELTPSTLDGRLQILEELIETADSAGIPNDRLLVDPSVVHMGQGTGQDLVHIYRESISALKEMVDPPVVTVAWISNISTGLPNDIKPETDATFLSYLIGSGLDAAVVDVLEAKMARTLYMLRAFGNEIVFSAAELEAKGLPLAV